MFDPPNHLRLQNPPLIPNILTSAALTSIFVVTGFISRGRRRPKNSLPLASFFLQMLLPSPMKPFPCLLVALVSRVRSLHLFFASLLEIRDVNRDLGSLCQWSGILLGLWL